MIIDAHNHPDWHGHDLPSFLENMRQFGIDRTWLLSWESPSDEVEPQAWKAVTPVRGEDGPIPFARCLRYKEMEPDGFVLGYAPDPRKPDAIDRLEAAVSIHGVRVCGEVKLRMTYDNPDALRLFRFCGERKLPVVVHLDNPSDAVRGYPRPDWWYGGGLEALVRAARACPETVFLGHAPGFWSHISADDQAEKPGYPSGPVVPGGRLVTALRELPNLYCDLSAGSARRALERDRGFSREFLIEFQDRVLYGRDYFDNVHQDLLNSLELPADVLSRIYSGNALRLIGER
jgi:predicted TIM-barrel fold metal-dependent hydrolase